MVSATLTGNRRKKLTLRSVSDSDNPFLQNHDPWDQLELPLTTIGRLLGAVKTLACFPKNCSPPPPPPLLMLDPDPENGRLGLPRPEPWPPLGPPRPLPLVPPPLVGDDLWGLGGTGLLEKAAEAVDWVGGALAFWGVDDDPAPMLGGTLGDGVRSLFLSGSRSFRFLFLLLFLLASPTNQTKKEYASFIYFLNTKYFILRFGLNYNY